MADRTSARSFGRAFIALATIPPSPERDDVVRTMLQDTHDFDFSHYQMGDDAIAALEKLGAKRSDSGDMVMQPASESRHVTPGTKLTDDTTVIPTLEALARRCPAERVALLAAVGALRPQQPLPGIDPTFSLPGPDAKELVELGRESKVFIREAGEGAVPDELLMRAAVVYGQLIRRGMLPPIADAMTRAHAIALIGAGFEDHPPSTPQRAALFATKLED